MTSKLELGTLIAKASDYKKVLNNTIEYRKEWDPTLKPRIISTLEEILKETGINGKVEVNDQIKNLEAVVLDLGRTSSGIVENIEDTDIKRTMVKNNGSLIYQQLFNGKVIVMILLPYIEGYGKPHQPKSLEILRPAELTPQFMIRHVETFIKEITAWEDDDDDDMPSTKKAFNPIGFNTEVGATPQ